MIHLSLSQLIMQAPGYFRKDNPTPSKQNMFFKRLCALSHPARFTWNTGNDSLVISYTLPETNSRSTYKWMIGRCFISFWGKRPIFRGELAVSFREGNHFRCSKRKLVFEPSIFRGYVSFREGNPNISHL